MPVRFLAGCLQDHNCAVVIGEQSWGKGTVQDVIPMQRGESALKLTTRSYWRPSGREIDRYSALAQASKVWGVQPNEGFALKMTEEEVFDNLRHRSIRDLEGLMPPGSDATLNALKKLRLQDLESDPEERPASDDEPQPIDGEHGAEDVHVRRSPVVACDRVFPDVDGPATNRGLTKAGKGLLFVPLPTEPYPSVQLTAYWDGGKYGSHFKTE